MQCITLSLQIMCLIGEISWSLNTKLIDINGNTNMWTKLLKQSVNNQTKSGTSSEA